MILPFTILALGGLFVTADAWWARKRILAYCQRAGFEVCSFGFTFGWSTPFSPFRGKYILRGVLRDRNAHTELEAWFSSAGLISMTSDEPLEVRFGR